MGDASEIRKKSAYSQGIAQRRSMICTALGKEGSDGQLPTRWLEFRTREWLYIKEETEENGQKICRRRSRRRECGRRVKGERRAHERAKYLKERRTRQ